MQLLTRILRHIQLYKGTASFYLSINQIIFNGRFQRGYVYKQSYQPHNFLYFNCKTNFQLLLRKCSSEPITGMQKDINIKLDFLRKDAENHNVNSGELNYLINFYKKNLVDEKTILILLKCCFNLSPETDFESQLKLTQNLWTIIQNFTFKTNIYNECLKSQENQNIEIFLKEPINLEALENILMLNICSENYKQSFKLFKTIAEKNVINTQIIDYLILTLSINKNFAEILSIIELMNKNNLKTTNKTFPNLSQGFNDMQDFQIIININESKILNYEQKWKLINALIHKQNSQTNETVIIKILSDLINSNQILKAVNFIKKINSSVVLPIYFWTKLIQTNVPVETNLYILKTVHSGNIYNNILRLLAEFTIDNGLFEKSFVLIQAMKESNITIKRSYFSAILDEQKRMSGEKGIFEVLKIMKQMNFKIDFRTMFNHVMPFLNLTDPLLAYRKLSNNCSSGSHVFESFISYLMEKGMYEEAILVRKNYPNKVSHKAILSLLKGYKTTNDLENCLILYNMLLHSEDQNSVPKEQLKEKFIEAKNKFNGYLDNVNSYNRKNKFRHFSEMKINELEYLLRTQDGSKDRNSLMRNLLMKYCQQNKIEEAQELARKMTLEEFKWTNGLRSTLFKMYADNGMVDEALNQLDEINLSGDNFLMDDYKILDFASVLVKQGRIEECKAVLNKHYYSSRSGTVKNCWNLLNTVAYSEHSSYVHEILQILIQNGYSTMQSILAGPLVRAHLVKEDFTAAVDTFKQIAKEHNMTPLKQELMVILIDKQRASELGDVYNWVKLVHGNIVANANFAVALAQTNKMVQLKMFSKACNIDLQQINRSLNGIPESIQAKTLTNILEAFKSKENVSLDLLYDNLISILHRDGKYEELTNLLKNLEENPKAVNKSLKNKIKNILEHNERLTLEELVNSNKNDNTF